MSMADVQNMLPQHLADLRSSGLSDEQIAACGFRSETDAAKIRAWLNWKAGISAVQKLGPCLCIPFFDRNAEYTGYVRLKPDRPRIKGDRPVKYESPKGSMNRLFIPPGTRSVIDDTAVPLLITEGEKKAAKADQDGFRCIGVTGVWNWTTKREVEDGHKVGPRELIADMQMFAWNKRRVVIVFDSDITEKPEVQHAEYALFQVLRRCGADVSVARLPKPEERPMQRTAA